MVADYEEERSNQRFNDKLKDVPEKLRERVQLCAKLTREGYQLSQNCIKGLKGVYGEGFELLKISEISKEENELGIVHCIKEGMLVIAARGTTLSRQDLEDDYRVWSGTQHTSDRYQKVEELVRQLIERFDVRYEQVWLVGHSLGADVMLHVDNKLLADGIQVSLCCFNLPSRFTYSNNLKKVLGVTKLKKKLWCLKEGLEEWGEAMRMITDVPFILKDEVKFQFIRFFSGNGNEVSSQWKQYEKLEHGQVLFCLHERDELCSDLIEFYRRNDRRGRILLTNPLLPSLFHGEWDRFDFFPLPKHVTMILSKSRTPHAIQQWCSKSTVMKKVDFDLRAP